MVVSQTRSSGTDGLDAIFLKQFFFLSYYPLSITPLRGPYPIRVPHLSRPIYKVIKITQHRLNLIADTISIGCGVILYSCVVE